MKKGRKWLKIVTGVVGFLLVTAVLCLIGGMGVEYVLVKGPSGSMRETFTLTMLETRRFTWIPGLILSDEEVEQIRSKNSGSTTFVTDTSLVTVDTEKTEETLAEEGLVDEDGDGLILEEVKGKAFTGYMLIVLDPKRVFVGKPDYYGDYGLTIGAMVKKYGAVAGINGGGFVDIDGTGSGGTPTGLTVVDGCIYQLADAYACFCGFDADGVLHVEYMDYDDLVQKNIVCGVTFGPALVTNGVMADAGSLASGINPRTAIGQRADGAVLMLVIDGRQAQSLGCTYGELAEIMLQYGAVNACNMDGGSSTCLYMYGDYVNSCSAATGARPLPTGFLVR